MEFINIYPVVFVLKHRDDGPTHNVIEVWKKNFTGQGVVVADWWMKDLIPITQRLETTMYV